MSDFISQFLGGQPAVTLGNVTFSGMEVPAKLPFGGKQQLVVHKLPGGARVIDSMGRDDLDLSWSGFFEGPLAMKRALELDQIRISGAVQQLSWDIATFSVVVGQFTADYTHTNWIPYTIHCVVVQDNTFQNVQNTSLLQEILNDVAGVMNSVMPIAAGVATAMSAVQEAMSVVNAVVPGSAAWQSAMVTLAQAQGAVADAQAIATGTIGGAMNGTAGLAGVAAGGSASLAAANTVAFAGAAANLAGSVAQSGYISNALSSLSGASA